MVRQTGQIIRRGSHTWLVRIYVGRDPDTRRRKYVGKFIDGGLRSAQAHLNCMLAERDLCRNTRSSRQTVGQYLDHWLDIFARPRLRAKNFRDYSSLLARYVRPNLGSRSFGELSPPEIQKLYCELLNRKLSPRTIFLYTCGSLFGLETGGPLETPPNEPGRGCPSASAITPAFHRVRCQPGEAVHRGDIRT
jgi:hypothetical protein